MEKEIKPLRTEPNIINNIMNELDIMSVDRKIAILEFITVIYIEEKSTIFPTIQ